MTFVAFFFTALLSIETPEEAPQLSADIDEAAQKTGMPASVIRAVVRIESRGRTNALSAKGAMGVMQLMPKTWAYWRNKLGLGVDPLDAHDNLLAGSFYLRQLYDTYGWQGAFVAYNAGPKRYESFRDLAKPLPSETRLYVQKINAALGWIPRVTVVDGAERPRQTETDFVAQVPPGTAQGDFTAVATPFVTLVSLKP